MIIYCNILTSIRTQLQAITNCLPETLGINIGQTLQYYSITVEYKLFHKPNQTNISCQVSSRITQE